jgi:DNA-binding NarL/FixJ family response regulator
MFFMPFMSFMDPLHRGRAAFGTRAWAEAYAHLSSADQATPLEADDLERLAISAYLIGADAVSIETWTRAYNDYLRTGNAVRAARCVVWMVFELLGAGEWARASGWLATVRRLLHDGQLDCAERGLVAVIDSRSQLKDGNEAAADDFAAEAVTLSDRFADPDLQAFGRLSQGLVHARRGEANLAVALFDEAMIAVTAGDVSPITVGVVYCAVIDACYEILDLARAREWTAVLARWCAGQPDLVPFRGHCSVHRAETMRLCGAWSSAMEEAGRACGQSHRGYPIGAAFYELAEIHRMRGQFREAEEAYRQASLHGRSPEPGLALLRLAEGHSEPAATAIRRLLDLPQKRWARANVLASAVEILITARDLATAHAAAEELATMAAAGPASYLRALAAQARGRLLLEASDPRAAQAELRTAWMAWQELEIPYEGARVRELIGSACRALGDEDAAAMEFEAARQVFLRLEASPAVTRVDQLLASSTAATGSRLTGRELQVIRLLASGRTNRAIARQLTISQRTVDRHVSNILTKLNLPSRSAATAYAYQHNLI